MDWLSRLESPQNALAVLTAMITPAVLISACGALIFSTSTRMGRVVDRVRTLSERFEALARSREDDPLDRQTSRARLLQRAMVAFYAALCTFISSSVAIAVVSAAARSFTWVAAGLGLLGSVFMLYASVLLVVESRMALGAIMSEMDFVWQVSAKYAAKDMMGQVPPEKNPGGPFTWLGRKIG
jgi:hypothetical protein